MIRLMLKTVLLLWKIRTFLRDPTLLNGSVYIYENINIIFNASWIFLLTVPVVADGHLLAHAAVADSKHLVLDEAGEQPPQVVCVCGERRSLDTEDLRWINSVLEVCVKVWTGPPYCPERGDDRDTKACTLWRGANERRARQMSPPGGEGEGEEVKRARTHRTHRTRWFWMF